MNIAPVHKGQGFRPIQPKGHIVFKCHVEYYSLFNEDEKLEEDLYFNLSRHELVEMLGEGGSNPISRLVAAQSSMSQWELYQLLSDLVLAAYGVPSTDRKSFRKNERLREAFKNSPAFDTIMERFANSEEESMKFFRGIIPRDMRSTVAKALDSE